LLKAGREKSMRQIENQREAGRQKEVEIGKRENIMRKSKTEKNP
jgi:hypothetical protein